MSVLASLQNGIFLSLPAVVFALVVWRRGARPALIAKSLGMAVGSQRYWGFAAAACVPLAAISITASLRTVSFAGSPLAPFAGHRPDAPTIIAALAYGFVATGFPEELLFRGLIAGALFRRFSFWKANAIQAAIFLLPHLLILTVAPRLWPLVVIVPTAFGLFAGWLRFASASFVPGAVIHSVSNFAAALAVLHWRG